MNDPRIPIETLMNANVLATPSDEQLKKQKETADLEKKIKAARKSSTFSMKLNTDELNKIKRQADSVGQDWKEWLSSEVRRLVFDINVGKPIINSMTGFSGKKITGPSDRARLGN